MFNPIKVISQIFYSLRDTIWNYPEVLIGDNSLRTYFQKVYRASVPYSHFATSAIIIILITAIFFSNFRNILNANSSTLIEGVIMGSDASGNLQTITKVDPLRSSNIQLERDLSELIYEPLLKSEFAHDGSGLTVIRNILAEEVIRIRQGADYQFSLRRGVYWHDGRLFNADDVLATFNFVSQLDSDNAYIRAVKQLRWEKLDDYNIRVCTKASDDRTCEQSRDNPILSNFLELISIKIIPAHMIENVDPRRIDTQVPDLFRSPIGTGRYKFYSVEDRFISLVRNDQYYDRDRIPSIENITFKLFPTFEDGVRALENGEIHTLSSVSSEFKRSLEDFPQIDVNISPVLYNQYWSIYFNLRKDPSGNTIGSPFFQDEKVRKAISMGINRDTIVDNALQGVAEEAVGPIPVISEFFNNNTNWYRYNQSRARLLLEEAGWFVQSGEKIRTNSEGEKLSFSLYFVDSFDRQNVARSIKNDLEAIGVEVRIDRREQPGQDQSRNAPTGWSLSEINNQYLLPRNFDAILYGMYTFIDPDRFELFHRNQISDPGLNIAGYQGSVESVQIRPDRQEGESSLITVPRVDRLLEETRALDTIEDAGRRKLNYNEIQDLIAEDAPVVFLYHPRFIYYSHSRVSSVTLENVTSVEDRFRNIEKWLLN